jgi:hypothetical protein
VKVGFIDLVLELGESTMTKNNFQRINNRNLDFLYKHQLQRKGNRSGRRQGGEIEGAQFKALQSGPRRWLTRSLTARCAIMNGNVDEKTLSRSVALAPDSPAVIATSSISS